jgi:hypothetical protein
MIRATRTSFAERAASPDASLASQMQPSKTQLKGKEETRSIANQLLPYFSAIARWDVTSSCFASIAVTKFRKRSRMKMKSTAVST